jgi:hypothetical protein
MIIKMGRSSIIHAGTDNEFFLIAGEIPFIGGVFLRGPSMPTVVIALILEFGYQGAAIDGLRDGAPACWRKARRI